MAQSLSIQEPWRRWASAFLDLIFPLPASDEPPARRIEGPICEKCGVPFEGRVTDVCECSDCRGNDFHFTAARAGSRFEGETREAIHAFKYHGQYYRIEFLGRALVEAYDSTAFGGPIDGLVPVPLHHRRHRERGFNQAFELARYLARERKVPLVDCLRRVRETPSQVSLDRATRRKNLRHAFATATRSRFNPKGKRLLLIDDVFTTGATGDACARVLREAGAGPIFILTVARG